MDRKRCSHCQVPVSPTDADTCPFCTRPLGEVSQIDAAALAELADQSVATAAATIEQAYDTAKQSRIQLARKIGVPLGFVVGWIVWQAVGGLGGFFLAVLLVVPVVSGLFVAVFSRMGGVNKRQLGTSEIVALISRSRATTEVMACRQCGYNGVMIIKRRRSLPVMALLLFLYVIPGIIYILVIRGDKVVCPKCNNRQATRSGRN